MKFSRLLTLFPCENLEDFELERSDEDAEQLLAAWSALWHPTLLVGQEDMPCWLPPSTPPPDPKGCLVVVPDCCRASLPEDWTQEAESAGATVLQGIGGRAEILKIALGRLGDSAPSVDPELAADFMALGFCHLQVELFNHKSRYASNLDATALRVAALEAAQAAVDGDADEARRQLQAAFDRLHEAREYFHSLDIRLLDLTLLAPTTIGRSLRDELSSRSLDHPANLLATAELIARMARDEPETLAALEKALDGGTAELIGGEYDEAPLPLLDPESIAGSIARGLAEYEKHLHRRPAVFGRRRFGLTPVLPAMLRHFGFTAALHSTLDDGRFPLGSQARLQWEGLDSTCISVLGRVPLDAGRPGTFLRLPEKLNDAMTTDQTPTLVFAHWPGMASPWYDDLRRVAAYSSVIGSFMSMSSYFEATSFAGHRECLKPDDYRSPYLTQDATGELGDPISRIARYHSRRTKLDACHALRAMAGCITAERDGRTAGDSESDAGNGTQLARDIESARDGGLPDDAAIDSRLDDLLRGFAHSIGCDSSSPQRGRLAVNTASTASLRHGVDVPALGFTWTPANAASPARPAKKRRLLRSRSEPPLAEANILRNEFFEIRIDPATGAIGSVSDYHGRDPRLAQQIAMRLSGGGRTDDESNYSRMVAERIETTAAGPVFGEIVGRGRLVDRNGRRLAGFKQTTRVQRSSRVIELLIDLDVELLPEGNPWNSYYAARFAWKDETLSAYRGMNLANVPAACDRIETPYFVDLRRDRLRTTIFCGGLPYHRRFGLRKLDTLLIVPGETTRSFRLGVGIDVPHPVPAAMQFISPPLEMPDQPPPSSPTGWLFHLDRRNVVATHWATLSAADADALYGQDNERSPTPHLAGFRVRLLETDGRGVSLGLRCPRTVSSARLLPFGDGEPRELVVDADRVEVPLGPHQWAEVEVQF